MLRTTVLFEMIQLIYPKFRPILLAAVDDPDVEWDNVLMGVIDRIFDYQEK